MPNVNWPPPMILPPPIGYADRNSSPPKSDDNANANRDGNRRSGWGPVLVIACLVLGILASALQLVRERLQEESARANDLNTTTVYIESQTENLGRLMADPQTHLVDLSGPAGSAIHAASLAWNPTKNSGVLFCDSLPVFDSTHPYEIWSTTIAGPAARLARFHAQAGVSVYPFKAPAADGEISSFEITAGPRLAGQAPLLIGTIKSPRSLGG
ncbi:MAG: hypothetical protein M3O30_12325 [Planctomycetota bacterium]|nr:hypothetical protein [Planctomycetota bacterium]